MKRHRSFELGSAKVLEGMGYVNIDVTRGVADWGADVFCEKDGIKYVGQVKMYGTSKTKISRKDVMELYGVMAYFDCQGAFFLYSGKRTAEALKAAEKLGIAWYEVNHMDMDERLEEDVMSGEVTIDYVWEKYIRPMEGSIYLNTQGFANCVVEVTDAYILKESEKGIRTKVKKDWFKWIIDRIRHYGFAEAIDLINEFHTQASSFVTLIFAQIPMFKFTYNPRRIEFNNRIFAEKKHIEYEKS
jgi:hypothetical protein